MKIKTRLTIIMISTISVILMFLATQFFVTKLMQKNIVQESILEEITDGIFKLDVFTYDYLLYRTERAYEQWWLMHNKIRKLFATLKFQIKEHKDIWDDIITGHKILGDIFSRLLVEYKESITYKEGANIFKEIENRLMGQLLQESQLIVTKASQLNSEIEEQTHNIYLRFYMLNILFLAILLIIILINSLLITKRITNPIIKLQEGSKIIGSGNLGYKVGTDKNDEIGELSRSFDYMGENLKKVTASRDELNKEITEHKRAEEQIKTSLKEKEVLLREIHHRVKNNMQVTSSLLYLQSRRIKDKKIVEIFKESESRLKTMALVHDKLYQSESLANINFRDYVDDLIKNLYISYGVNADKISANIEIEDIFLEIDLAAPCGLIINELVSNSLKHAFPRGRTGEIKIVLRAVNENELELIVSDDGVGMAEELDFESTDSFGLHIVKLLIDGQLEGKLELLREQGTEYRIRFKRPVYSM